MRIPNFLELAEEHHREGFQAASYATFMHPKPFFYKYYWWVFWQESPCDGREFLTKRYRMPTKQAFDLTEKLASENQSYWLYNQRRPRLDPANTPFDPQAKLWQGVEWAKSFDEDPDDEFKGHK
ncbi:MAG: hypothetical protein WCP01_17240 [Methylococcaceae bacterium]|jgi:hypothetical protein